MRKYLLPQGGAFYKANLHCHTTVSDGKMTPEEVKAIYKDNGYSVVAYTDHEIMISHEDLAEEGFLPLNGYEISVTEISDKPWRVEKSCHICLIALEPDNLKQVCFHRTKYIGKDSLDYLSQIVFDQEEPDFEREHTHENINKIMETGRKNGFFVTFNHPKWSLENYNDYMGYHHMHAMEIYNHGAARTGYPEYNEKEYEDMLRGGKRIYCISTDDNHKKEDCFGGFTMIKAENLEYRTITQALLDGNFYASQGPLIHNLWVEDNQIHVECSDAVSIALRTNSRRAMMKTAQEGEYLNQATFPVVLEDVYVRITIVDEKGRCANTNAYFTDTLV